MSLGCSAQEVVLNLGCGSGFQNKFLNIKNLIGIDNNIWRLKAASSYYQHQPFICSDALALPIKNQSVDRIVTCDFIEHVKNLEQLYSEIYRVLKPSGSCVISFPAEGGFAYGLGRRFTTKKHYEKTLNVDYMKLIRQEHLHTARELLSSIRQCFHIFSLKYVPFRIPSINLNACIIATCRLK